MSEHIKKRLPDMATVEEYLKNTLETNLPDFLSSTHSSRKEVIDNRRFTVLAFLFAIAVLLALSLIQDIYGYWVKNFLIVCAIIWLFVVIFTGRRWMINDKLLAK